MANPVEPNQVDMGSTRAAEDSILVPDSNSGSYFKTTGTTEHDTGEKSRNKSHDGRQDEGSVDSVPYNNDSDTVRDVGSKMKVQTSSDSQLQHIKDSDVATADATGELNQAAQTDTHKNTKARQEGARQAPKNSDKFIPFFREYTLINEYKLLRDNSPPGMYVIPSTETTQIWHGVLFVREGSYEGGIFKFDVYIPDNFPTEEVPTIQFTSDVFHPAVDAKTGLVSLDRKWDKWEPHRTHLYSLLADLHGMFINLDVERYTQANPDAYNILMNDQQLFKIKVRQRVEHSKAHVYTTRDGKGSIHFEEYRNDVHGPVLRNILQNKWRSSVQHSTLGNSNVRRPPT
ncbi:hypothetical protein SARC_03872 [Sphaeroforma arctica JP610]|uniref:UBC core domain-containing protein n=1 Tax=Sphaeroforma arctica JP610 TaxID=667725 RepID=A0A0L0G445_9EUKA|nr:hypothetical protein SARC_03872 [Sphaeroforma arctica JP610]KNC83882.1 hypothetical protein SARC_03872 [Sphaeroforma arctica JP610]|eukprot:XP_014157784.1 hypothetical protein SARC_03872 [Sphaeroforma arctica JP610]